MRQNQTDSLSGGKNTSYRKKENLSHLKPVSAQFTAFFRILGYPNRKGGGFLPFEQLSEETKRNLKIAGACTAGVAVLLYPAALVTLGLGVALGYKGQEAIQDFLKGGKGE